MKNTQRLDKVLANFGFGSRVVIKKSVKDGLVKVNGQIAVDASMQVDPEKSTIEVNGKQLNYRKNIYIMMNKPAGVISATFDKKLKTAIDLLPEEFACFDLFPAGRLDIDTEGMLLLTDDGQLAHNLLSPKKHVDKKYYALIDGLVTEEDVLSFKEGVRLDDGYLTMPAELEILQTGLQAGKSVSGRGQYSEQGQLSADGLHSEEGQSSADGQYSEEGQSPADGLHSEQGQTSMDGLHSEQEQPSAEKFHSEIELILHEGKFHQVKRMFEAVGKKVLYLKRMQMGGLKLDAGLRPGECRELTPEEVGLLQLRG